MYSYVLIVYILSFVYACSDNTQTQNHSAQIQSAQNHSKQIHSAKNTRNEQRAELSTPITTI